MEQDSNPGGTVLGIFAKIPGEEPVKTRLQPWLSPARAESFYVACIADAIETAFRVAEIPVLFLTGDPRRWSGLRQRLVDLQVSTAMLDHLHLAHQSGADLGERLQNAFDFLHGRCDPPRASLIVGSDSPSLAPDQLTLGLHLLQTKDLVLGPAADGGYYAIGLRRPQPGLLTAIPWSSPGTFDATFERARQYGLQVATLEAWTDVDRPEDVEVLAGQISRLRIAGDAQTARHAESMLRRLGLVDSRSNWIGGSD